MTRDEILRMAREAKLPDPMVFYASIERFAALIAAAEREACARLCDVEAERLGWPTERFAADNCAEAIRARGQQ